jgi:nitrogen regulatory protein P-II 1
MKEIKAIIRPFKLDDVITALKSIKGMPGITISEIKGFGKIKVNGKNDVKDGNLNDYEEKIKIELVVNNDIVHEVINTIQKIAHTGNRGDGKIFIMDVINVVKIRTNERGNKAV